MKKNPGLMCESLLRAVCVPSFSCVFGQSTALLAKLIKRRLHLLAIVATALKSYLRTCSVALQMKMSNY
jgi:hypothetical protein